MIEVRGIEKHYGTVEALRGVSFSIDSGEIIGLLGPNGAGKTTLIRVLTCYHYPSAGLAMVNGSDVTESPVAVKQQIGYLPENAPIYQDMTVLEYLRFMGRARKLKAEYREERIKKVIGQCALKDVLFRPIHKLSKGFRQRVGLAQAILHDPPILILDEPTNGLDPNQIVEIRSLIQKLGKEKTVILSTHVMQEVEALCNRVLIINEGALVAHGTTAEISGQMKGEQSFEILLRVPDKIKEADIRKGVQKIPAVQSIHGIGVQSVDGSGTIYKLDVGVHTDNDEHAGAHIFSWAADSGYALLALIPSKLKLEDIFVRLTN